MISQFTPPTAYGFSRFVVRWLKLLSEQRFDEAVRRLDKAGPGGPAWGIEEIQQALRDFSHDSRLPEVTDPARLPEPDDCRFDRFEDWRGYWLEYPLPLDGEWSGLRVRFEFLRRPGGYAMVLAGFIPSGREGTTSLKP
ncbi:MAG: hypothetical protein AB1896_11590 [Thermodesulfobacteriota bacterium]